MLSDSNVPLKPSPFNGNTYRWRLIDFEHASKVNFARTAFRHYYWPTVDAMIALVESDTPSEDSEDSTEEESGGEEE